MNFGIFASRNNNVVPALMVYWALVAPASVLHYLGIKGLYSTVLVLGAAIIFGFLTRKPVRVSTLTIAAILALLSIGNVLHWNDLRYVFYCIFLICALIIVEISGRNGIERFCTMATSLMLVLLVGAVISFLLARIGAPPIWVITNPDGQDYYFFYTGFTNSYYDNIIRASAIYDEPGAFSMYICFIAALRHLLGRERRTTWTLLGLGFVTFSLAHFIYVLCHFLAEQPSKKQILLLLGAFSLLLSTLITYIALDSNILLLSRLALTEDTNFFAGDNRSFQLFNAWDQMMMNPSSILFGLDSSCVFNQTVCQDRFGPLGENPLSPLVFGGLASEWPYYLTVILFLSSPLFGTRNIALLGMGLLFLQRPYVTGFSYALIAVLLLDVAFRRGTTAIGARHHAPRSCSLNSQRNHASPV